MKSLCNTLLGTLIFGAFALEFPAAQAAQATEQTVHRFCRHGNCADGAGPDASLINVNGMLYGTTDGGGKYFSYGTVFSFDPDTGKENPIYSFCSDRTGGAGRICTDGANPFASLINVNGILYGTTSLGGRRGSCWAGLGCGTVFSLDLSTGAEKVLHSFAGGLDGASPAAAVIDVKGILYGITQYGAGSGCSDGGGSGCGAVFSLDPKTGTERVLHAFCSRSNCIDGARPNGGLISVNGMLYGATFWGGSYDEGTVFSIDPGAGTEKVVYSFCSQLVYGRCLDGNEPTGNLIEVNGTLYGTTGGGGGDRFGTLFSLDPVTGAHKVLYYFEGGVGDGAGPGGALIEVQGALYGITAFGGAQNFGTVFSFDPRTGRETVLYSFCSRRYCHDGNYPSGGLVKLKNRLYGTTPRGGHRFGRAEGVIYWVKQP